MAGITKRADGRWQAQLQVNGIRKTVYGKTKAEVQEKLAVLHRQAAGGLPNPGKRTINDLFDHFLDTVRPTLKPRTVADYEKLAHRYIRPAIGTVRLSRLNPDHVQVLYRDLQAKGLERAPSQVHRLLHRVFHLAVLWRWLAENPCGRVLPPTYRAPRKAVWTPDELRAFLDGARTDRHFLLWLFLLTSGCRLGEALGLRWDDVDWQAESVVIRRNLQRIDGAWVETTPKSAAGTRRVSLPKEGIEALRLQRTRQAEARLCAGAAWVDCGLVFTGDGGQPLHPSAPQHALPRLCERLGLPRVTPHGLRHLHASLLLASRLDIPLVSARLGHATPSITMSIYAHALGNADRQAAEALGRALAL